MATQPQQLPAAAYNCRFLLRVGFLVLALVARSTTASDLATATFAGGCFWCMQPPFDQLEGVVKTTVGYTGGHTLNPTYEQVSAGATGHAESIQVTYNPAQISYAKLLD